MDPDGAHLILAEHDWEKTETLSPTSSGENLPPKTPQVIRGGQDYAETV
jgi:hypothetical protein